MVLVKAQIQDTCVGGMVLRDEMVEQVANKKSPVVRWMVLRNDFRDL